MSLKYRDYWYATLELKRYAREPANRLDLLYAGAVTAVVDQLICHKMPEWDKVSNNSQLTFFTPHDLVPCSFCTCLFHSRCPQRWGFFHFAPTVANLSPCLTVCDFELFRNLLSCLNLSTLYLAKWPPSAPARSFTFRKFRGEKFKAQFLSHFFIDFVYFIY